MARKTKTVSGTKKSQPCIPSKGSQKVPHANAVTPDIRKSMVRDAVDGIPVWRQPLYKNAYNTQGITLAAIDHELADAKKVKEDKDWKVIELWHGRSNCYGSDEDRGILMKFGFCKDINFSAIPSIEPLQCLTRSMMLNSHQYLIKDDDAYFASLIKESPEALIMLSGAQDAWARWSYASHWGKEKSTTAEAKKYISSCLPGVSGRRPLHQFNNKLLLRAYDDCCDYIRCLYKCAKDLKDPKQVSELFPDAKRLEIFNIKLAEITKPKTPGRGASDVARKYIGKYYDLEPKTILNKITEAHGNSKKQNPA